MNNQPTPVLNHTASGSVPAKKKSFSVLLLGLFVLACLIGFGLWKMKGKDAAQIETASQIELNLLFPSFVGNNAEGKVLWGEEGGKNPAYVSELMFAQAFDYGDQQREWRVYRGINNDTGEIVVSSFVLGLAKTNTWEVIKGLPEAKRYTNGEAFYLNREAMFAEKAQFKLTHSGVLTMMMKNCVGGDGLSACNLALFALNIESNNLDVLGEVSLDSARTGETVDYEDKTTAQYLFQTGHHAVYDDVIVNYTYWVGEKKRRYSAVWVYSDREKTYISPRYESELAKNERFAGRPTLVTSNQNKSPEPAAGEVAHSTTPDHPAPAPRAQAAAQPSNTSTAPEAATTDSPEISAPVEAAPEPVSEPVIEQTETEAAQ